jgi:CheY-like chemotaxis protein
MVTSFVILIADPNPFVRSFLSRELSAEGHQTVEAGSSLEIFEQLKGERPPDLLVTELDWPVSIGISVLERIQNLVPPIPLIVFTHLTEYEFHPAVQNADDFIEKNENPQDLLNSISAILKR